MTRTRTRLSLWLLALMVAVLCCAAFAATALAADGDSEYNAKDLTPYTNPPSELTVQTLNNPSLPGTGLYYLKVAIPAGKVLSAYFSSASELMNLQAIVFYGNYPSSVTLSPRVALLTFANPTSATISPIVYVGTSAVGTFTVSPVLQAETTAPTVPTNLHVTSFTESAVSLAWTASTDNAGGTGVKGYKIYRNGAPVGQPTGTTFTDSGLSAATAYSYTISAVDNANNESTQTAPPVTATTQALHALTITSASASPSPATANQLISFTATVNDTRDHSISWTWTDNGAELSQLRTFSQPLSVGSHTLKVTAQCSGGLTASQTFTLNVVSDTVTITSASASPNPATEGQAVALTAAATDSLGHDVSYRWSEGATTLSSAQSFSKAFSAGAHTITLTATCSSGKSATRALSLQVSGGGGGDGGGVTDAITVDSASANPNPATAGQAVTFNASATDSAGHTISYTWSEGTTELSNLQSFAMSGLSVGTHSITVKATCSGGLSATKSVSVTVNPAGGGTTDTITITSASANPNPATAGQAVIFNASATDSANHAVSYTWTEGATQLAAGQSFSISVLSPGMHNITLKVACSGGKTATKTVTVFIRAATGLTAAFSGTASTTYPTPYGGGYVTITGVLSSAATTAPVTGQKVWLQTSYNGSSFTTSTASVIEVAGSPGRYQVRVRNTRLTYYRLVFRGTDVLAPSTSRVVRALPKAYLSAPVPSKTRVTRATYFSVSGYLKPRHSGTPVTIYCYRYEKVSGRYVWKLRATYYAKASNYSSYSRYTARIRLRYAGMWRLRAYHKDAAHYPTYSSYSTKVYVK